MKVMTSCIFVFQIDIALFATAGQTSSLPDTPTTAAKEGSKRETGEGKSHDEHESQL